MEIRRAGIKNDRAGFDPGVVQFWNADHPRKNDIKVLIGRGPERGRSMSCFRTSESSLLWLNLIAEQFLRDLVVMCGAAQERNKLP